MTKTSIYGVHPGVLMVQKWVEALKEKSGRSLDEWMEFIRTDGPGNEKECREWLKKEHGIGTNTAWWLAGRAVGNDTGLADEDPDSYLRQAEMHVEEMFGGNKAGLRPIYDRLLELGLAAGPEAKACPCKTIVPLYRNHVFAQIKPTTRTRIDLGFAFGNLAATGRLIDTGGYAKKDRITHRIPISALDEIDEEVTGWLKKAYDRDK